MIKNVFEYYLKRPEEIGDFACGGEERVEIRVKDYLAGMTDEFIEEIRN